VACATGTASFPVNNGTTTFYVSGPATQGRFPVVGTNNDGSLTVGGSTNTALRQFAYGADDFDPHSGLLKVCGSGYDGSIDVGGSGHYAFTQGYTPQTAATRAMTDCMATVPYLEGRTDANALTGTWYPNSCYQSTGSGNKPRRIYTTPAQYDSLPPVLYPQVDDDDFKIIDAISGQPEARAHTAALVDHLLTKVSEPSDGASVELTSKKA